MSCTISTHILRALESLTDNDLERFCFHLRDRREEPKISRRQVDETNPVKITDLLVSKFNELGAREVVLETLRLIGCNQEAETLESKTKACVDKGDPKTSNGKLDRKPLQEVENYAARKVSLKAAQQGRAPVMMMKQEEEALAGCRVMDSAIRIYISEELDNLIKINMNKFCFQVRNRSVEPKISCREVKDKRPREIADLLVSKFTALGALKVVLETLRLIGCNQEAQNLESKTKAYVDKGDPIFRKTSNGKLDTKPSQEAEFYAAGQSALKAAQQAGAPVKMKKPEEVEADAKAQVLSEGGDPGNDRLVLSRYVIQFGKYKGQKFKWLLENDVSYVAFLVAAHQKELKHSVSQSPTTAQKVSLTKYAIPYPDVLGEVRFHRAYDRAKERSLQPGQAGEALLGFGRYRTETLKDLYESKDKDKISSVNYLRGMKSTCDPGSKMEAAIAYISQRDQEEASAATAPSRPVTRSSTRATRKRRSKSNQDDSSSRPIQRNVKRTWWRAQQSRLLRY